MFTGIVREFLAGLLALLMTAAPAATTVQPVEEPAYVQEIKDVSPARTLSATAGTLSLDVDSPAGSLPKAAKASLSKVSKAKLNKIRKEAASLLGTEIIDAVAFDISFLNNGVEIEPDGKVNITVNFPAIAEAPCYTIIHFRDDGTTEIVPGNVTTTSATFSADNFSVYAVIGTGVYKRMTVNFYRGETLIETMYVKEADTLEDLKTIIYDPGVGEEIPEGQAFLGWSLVEDFTYSTASYSIAGIRTYINDMTFVDGKVINVYARIFKVFSVTYLAKEGVALGSDSVYMDLDASEVEVTITESFTPALDTQNFEGWAVFGDSGSNIVDYDADALYKLNDKLTITGSISLIAVVHDGHWLVYDENGKGATYNAPQFYKTDVVTSDAELLDMHRTGYEFGGWYTGAPIEQYGDPTGDLFTFGNLLTENTTLYAKWIKNATAPYTVLIWRQNVKGDGYDFAESVRLTGAVDQEITSVTSSGSGNNAVATVNGSTKRYQGFHFTRFDQNVTVAPEGSTVLNVYYDRNTVTLTFKVYSTGSDWEQTLDTTGELYGKVNGRYVRIYTDDNGETWYTISESSYIQIESESDPHYGLVNGEYVELTKYGDVWYYVDDESFDANTIGDSYYGYEDGSYFQLIFKNGKYYSQKTQIVYTPTTANNGTQYGLVNGEYVQIFRDGNRWYYNTYTPTTSNNGTQYGLIDGEYVQLTRVDVWGVSWWYNWSQYTGTRYTLTQTQYNGTRYVRTEEEIEYTGTIYTHNIIYSGTFYKPQKEAYTGDRYKSKGESGWKTKYIMEGLYGAPLSTSTTNTKAWPTDYNWYSSGSNNGGTSGTRTTFLDAFLLSNGGSADTFYGSASGGSRTVNFYKQNADGTWPSLETPTNTVSTGTGTFNISDKYNGYKCYSYSTNGTNWTLLGDKDPTTGYYTGIQNYSTLYIRYTPVLYNISFMDGVYVNGDGKPVAGYGSRGQLKVVEGIAYSSNLSSYNVGGDDYYAPTFSEFTFAGWFLDDACTQPYTFTSMPEGLTVYAKWIQNQYRVFLHSNAEGDDTLFWGSSSQAMSFRISSGSEISLPTGTRDGYNMIGWYVGPSLSTVYSKDTHLNDSYQYLEEYDMTTRMTDPMDIHGNIITGGETPLNSDATGYNGEPRFWITKQLDIYAKWSAAIPGAEGINVIYDPNGGTLGQAADTILYKDNVDAVAAAAAVPANQASYRFDTWVVQKWNGTKFADTSLTVYPGESFTVLKSNAKVLVSQYHYEWTVDYKDEEGQSFTKKLSVPGGNTEPILEENIDRNPARPDLDVPSDAVWNLEIVYTEATYTVQLRAEYVLKEEETPTHIIFFGNGGTLSGTGITGTADQGVVNEETYVGYTTLKINEAVDIAPATTFVNGDRKFLGWARIAEPDGLFTVDNEGKIVIDETKLTVQALTSADLWLTFYPASGSAAAFWECTVDNALKNVTQIAGDENTPTHILYAVWETPFYVYHSGVAGGNIETVFISEMGSKKYDLTQNLTGDTLYGGYYLEGGFTAPAAPTTEGDETSTALVPAYDGTNWTWTKAQTKEKGTAITPTAGTTYYVKEVPKAYLKPYTHIGFTGGVVSTLMLVTAIDDLTYDNVGFIVNGSETMTEPTAWYRSLRIRNGSGVVTYTLDFDQNNVFAGVKNGYIGYSVLNGTVIAPNKTVTVEIVWVTPDGLTVNGVVKRTITTGDGTTDATTGFKCSDATIASVIK